MRIGIDNVSTGLSTSHRTVGSMRHLLSDTVASLERVAPHHEYILFQPDWADALDLDHDSSVQVSMCRGVPPQRFGRIMYEQFVYPSRVDRADTQVFLGTCNTLPLRLACPSVVIMQSLQYFDYPQIYSRSNLIYLRTIVPKTLQKATRVIALSETSKQTVLKHVDIPPEKIHVIYHGLSSEVVGNRVGRNYEISQSLLRKFVGEDPYILSVSSFYWQKNLPRLIESFARLKQDLLPHRLLLVGGDGPNITKHDLLELAVRLGVADSIVFSGVVPHSHIPAFYMNAAVAVMPSLYETFGFPVLEAMSCGCPVVTSNVGTMAEIGQRCAVLVDPYDVDSIADGIARVIRDSDLRNRMIACGLDRSKAFSLEIQAQRYIEVLEEAVNA